MRSACAKIVAVAPVVPVIIIISCSPALPAPVMFVLDHASQFVPQPGGLLAQVEPGTPIDDLQRLDDCWAQVRLRASGAPGNMTVFQFDGRNGSYTVWETGGPEGDIQLGSRESGRFDIVEAGMLRLSATAGAGRDLLGQWYEWTREVPVEQLYLATIDGNGMLLVNTEHPDSSFDSVDHLYTRFECPRP